MSRPRTKGASPSKSKVIAPDAAAARQTTNRARALIERMLQEMELGLLDANYRTSEEWERLFGAKQSMVVNLQKLVGALAVLPACETATAQDAEMQEAMTINPEELALLKAWMEEENA